MDQINFGVPPKVVRHAGDLNSVIVDGMPITREEKVYIPGIGMVACAPYDNHFVYRTARHLGWTLFCTCGSPAVVAGYDAYKNDASSQGQLLLCLVHASSGKHADGSS